MFEKRSGTKQLDFWLAGWLSCNLQMSRKIDFTTVADAANAPNDQSMLSLPRRPFEKKKNNEKRSQDLFAVLVFNKNKEK